MDYKKILESFKKNSTNYLLIIVIVIFLFSFLAGFDNRSISKSSSFGISQMSYDNSFSNSIFEEEVTESLKTNSMISKRASLNLISEDISKDTEKIKQELKNFDTKVLNENFNEYGNYKYLSLNLKVSSEDLEPLLDRLRQYGEVENFQINKDDKLEKFEYSSSKLDRYKSQVEKYKNMLDRDNLEIADEIKINQRIDSLEDSIFRVLRSIENIEDEVTYSNVNLRIKENVFLGNVNNFSFKNIFEDFVKSLIRSFELLLTLIAYIIPFGIVYLVYRLIRKFIKN